MSQNSRTTVSVAESFWYLSAGLDSLRDVGLAALTMQSLMDPSAPLKKSMPSRAASWVSVPPLVLAISNTNIAMAF